MSLAERLPALRDDLVAALQAAGLTVYGYLPSRVQPPVVIVEPADPYLTDELDYLPSGSWQVAYDLHLIVESAIEPETRSRDLDELIGQALDALDLSDWGAATVARPYLLDVAGERFPATVVTVTTTTR